MCSLDPKKGYLNFSYRCRTGVQLNIFLLDCKWYIERLMKSWKSDDIAEDKSPQSQLVRCWNAFTYSTAAATASVNLNTCMSPTRPYSATSS